MALIWLLVIGLFAWQILMVLAKMELLARFHWASRGKALVMGVYANIVSLCAGFVLVVWPHGLSDTGLGIAINFVIFVVVEGLTVALVSPRRMGRGLAAIAVANLAGFALLVAIGYLASFLAPLYLHP